MSTPALDPDLLKAFVAVADQRSLTRAAAALNRTQSAISAQIKKLEDRLQTKLFHRSTTHVEISSAGETLLGYARRIMALNDEAIGRLREHAVEGVVRLGVMDDYGTLIVPPLLASFGKAHPRIKVDMETGLTAGMVDRLGTDFDLVIAMHPAGAGSGELLSHEQAVWAAGPIEGIEDTDPLPVALYPNGCLFRQWAIEALDRAGISWRLAFVSHSLAAVEAIAAQGLAVTVVKAGMMPRTLRQISAKSGWPRLPRADIRLHRSPGLIRAAALLADCMAERLKRR